MTLNFPDVSQLRFLLSLDCPKPGSVLTWTIFHTSPEGWGYEAGSTWTSSEPEQSRDPLVVVPAATFVSRWSSLQKDRSEQSMAS